MRLWFACRNSLIRCNSCDPLTVEQQSLKLSERGRAGIRRVAGNGDWWEHWHMLRSGVSFRLALVASILGNLERFSFLAITQELPHPISSQITWPHPITLMSPHPLSPHLIIAQLTSSHLTFTFLPWSHLASHHFTLSSPYLISCWSQLTSSHLEIGHEIHHRAYKKKAI